MTRPPPRPRSHARPRWRATSPTTRPATRRTPSRRGPSTSRPNGPGPPLVPTAQIRTTCRSTSSRPLPARAPRSSLRRGVVVAALALVVGAATAAWPYWGLALVLGGSWLLRTCTMTVTAHGDRRRLRGARWYDVLLAPLTAPWYLLAAVPGRAAARDLGARHRRRRGPAVLRGRRLDRGHALRRRTLRGGRSVARAGRLPRPLAGPRGRARDRATYRALGGAHGRAGLTRRFPGPPGLARQRLVAVRETTADRPLSPRFHSPFGPRDLPGQCSCLGYELPRRSVRFFLPGTTPGVFCGGEHS